MLPTMVKKTMDQHVVLNLASTIVVSTSFDMWMFHDSVDIFNFVINFTSNTYVPMHITVGLFEMNETTE
jgi:hypothetical protein